MRDWTTARRWPLILKDLSRERLLGDAAATKPEFLHEPAASSRPTAASSRPAGIGPRCFAAVAEPRPAAPLAAAREGAGRRALAGRRARGLGGGRPAGSAGSTPASPAGSTSCEPRTRTCSSTRPPGFAPGASGRRAALASPTTRAQPALARGARRLRRGRRRARGAAADLRARRALPVERPRGARRRPSRGSARSTGRWRRSAPG